MDWKTSLNGEDFLMNLPQDLFASGRSQVTIGKDKFEVEYCPRLQVAYINKEGSSVSKHIRIKRKRVEKDRDAPESQVRMEISQGCLIDEFSSESWVYTPASEQRRKSAAAKGASLKSPMTGKVLEIMSKTGDHVEKGDIVLVIEAMKMENKITAPASGIVQGLSCQVGENLNAGQVLAQIKAPTT